MNVAEVFDGLGPIEQALLAGLFTWFMTAAGAGIVFFFKEIKNLSSGFANDDISLFFIFFFV